MSADLLRRAAALMRERAEVAIPGPWYVSEVDDDFAEATVSQVDPSLPHGVTVEVAATKQSETFEGDAQHIASWHPAVALAVADWLDAEADSSNEIAEYVAPEALTVARAYLGDQP